MVLGRSDIVIEISSNDRFILKRGDQIATNLSEGEKTAISFSYFLVTLESLHKESKLTNTIVFIDDPISSLDSNHIAHVYSLINSFFFRQGLDAKDPNKYVNCFKQLFISTHNFMFFSFLRDSPRIKKKGTKNYYFVERESHESSKIIKIPDSLNTQSEYLYLFERIHTFYSSGCSPSSSDIILLPNAIRRFLELYTLIKLPGCREEIDHRLNLIVGGVHQLKVLHHFSHLNSLEYATQHDELMVNIKPAVHELIGLLKKDELHYESLLKAVE